MGEELAAMLGGRPRQQWERAGTTAVRLCTAQSSRLEAKQRVKSSLAVAAKLGLPGKPLSEREPCCTLARS